MCEVNEPQHEAHRRNVSILLNGSNIGPMVPAPWSYQHEEHLGQRNAGLDHPNESDFEVESR